MERLNFNYSREKGNPLVMAGMSPERADRVLGHIMKYLVNGPERTPIVKLIEELIYMYGSKTTEAIAISITAGGCAAVIGNELEKRCALEELAGDLGISLKNK